MIVVILGLLATIVVVSMRRFRGAAEQSTCAADREVVERAAALWSRSSDEPPTVDALVDAGLLRTRSKLHGFDDAGSVVPLGPLCPETERTDAGGGGGVGGGGGAGGSGDPGGPAGSVDELVEVTLSWSGNADLDLLVRTPSGALIAWTDPDAGGGHLDVDVVPARPDDTGPHVERVVWSEGAAVEGRYTAWAVFQSDGWGAQTSATYTLTFRAGDVVLGSVWGAVGPAGTQTEPLPVDVA